MLVKHSIAAWMFISTSVVLTGPPPALADDAPVMVAHVENIHTQHAMPVQPLKSETVRYAIPAVTLVRDDGKVVSLPQEMNDGRPVLLNFIFTSCGSTCPLMSQVFAQFQRKLGPDARQVHLMSISIDPEADTPGRLAEYARRFGAGPEWQHYTGTLDASLAAQRAFDIYRGDKMSHVPVTLMRAAPDQPWRRIDGLVTPDDLLREYRQLLASK
jgi:protein SCO1/2